ncbi:hypothetical protein D9615_007260 [Tricholomella constricta]|uniref:DUF3752 domain-containing protein n=1 Tax=Tricholomella constricta TaxID=117010 RepID=A0A8H5H587_9AGAR|nr:hypothetical protein D9615_007260 [Tricholomella constricta]
MFVVWQCHEVQTPLHCPRRSGMAAIGPELPPHLLRREEGEDNKEAVSVGPQIPPGRLNQQNADDDDDEDEDDYVPELPPDLAATRSAGLSHPEAGGSNSSEHKRVVGPSMPSYPPTYDPKYHSVYDDDSDDDDFGPKPLPAGVKHAETDAVKEFMDREERRRKIAEEAAKPKALKRDEWMLVPPSSSDLLGNLDPTKLKARQFSRSTAPPAKKTDNSLWTETPAERQQRLADEVSGKKRRAVETSADDDVSDEKKRRRMDEELIRKGVDEYTASTAFLQKRRGPALVSQHEASGKAVTPKEKEGGIWDHSRDMGLGGRLMDDSKRTKLIREAQGLGDRFGTGKSGGFL